MTVLRARQGWRADVGRTLPRTIGPGCGTTVPWVHTRHGSARATGGPRRVHDMAQHAPPGGLWAPTMQRCASDNVVHETEDFCHNRDKFVATDLSSSKKKKIDPSVLGCHNCYKKIGHIHRNH